MNKKIVFISILIVAILISSCKKKNVLEEIIPNVEMTAKINGVSWKAVARVTRITSGNIIITGTGETSGEKIINITVFSTNEGTYKLDLNPLSLKNEFTASYNPKISTLSDSSYAANSGTVVISKIDISSKKISGTFSFSSKRVSSPVPTLEVTEGSFSNLLYTD